MEEETKNLEEQKVSNEEKTLKTHRFIIMLLAGFLAIFLGAFLAFFAVFNHLLKPNTMALAFDNDKAFMSSETMFKNFDKEFDRMMSESMIIPVMPRFRHHELFKPENATFRAEETPKEYKLIVNLKDFGNDEKNVDFKADKNQVTISAKYKNDKDKNSFISNSFYQSFNMPENIDPSKVKKEKSGNNLVIIIQK